MISKSLVDAHGGKGRPTPMPEINEGAVVYLRAQSPVMYRDFLRVIGGCITCSSMSFFERTASQGKAPDPCPDCGGKNDALDRLSNRIAFIKRVVTGWEGLRTFSPECPEGELLAFDEDGITIVATTDREFFAIVMRAFNLVNEVGKGKAPSLPQLVDSSDTTPIGSEV